MLLYTFCTHTRLHRGFLCVCLTLEATVSLCLPGPSWLLQKSRDSQVYLEHGCVFNFWLRQLNDACQKDTLPAFCKGIMLELALFQFQAQRTQHQCSCATEFRIYAVAELEHHFSSASIF